MPNDDWRQATPLGLRRNAHEFQKVAVDALTSYRNRLPENRRHHTIVPFPIYYNYLHAVELALKSFMVYTGSDLPEMRRIGHDLAAAIDICIERGIRAKCEDITDVMLDTLRHANLMYEQKDFEYIRVGYTELAHIDQIAMALDALLCCVDQIDMRPAQPH